MEKWAVVLYEVDLSYVAVPVSYILPPAENDKDFGEFNILAKWLEPADLRNPKPRAERKTHLLRAMEINRGNEKAMKAEALRLGHNMQKVQEEENLETGTGRIRKPSQKKLLSLDNNGSDDEGASPQESKGKKKKGKKIDKAKPGKDEKTDGEKKDGKMATDRRNKAGMGKKQGNGGEKTDGENTDEEKTEENSEQIKDGAGSTTVRKPAVKTTGGKRKKGSETFGNVETLSAEKRRKIKAQMDQDREETMNIVSDLANGDIAGEPQLKEGNHSLKEKQPVKEKKTTEEQSLATLQDLQDAVREATREMKEFGPKLALIEGKLDKLDTLERKLDWLTDKVKKPKSKGTPSAARSAPPSTPGTGRGDLEPPSSRGDLQSPGGSRGDLQSPGGSRGDLQSPGGSRGDLQSPGGSRGDLQSPGGSRGDLQSPAGSRGDLQSPAGSRGDLESPSSSRGDLESPFGSRGLIGCAALGGAISGALHSVNEPDLQEIGASPTQHPFESRSFTDMDSQDSPGSSAATQPNSQPMVLIGAPARQVRVPAEAVAKAEECLAGGMSKFTRTGKLPQGVTTPLLGALFTRKQLAESSALGDSDYPALDHNKVQAIFEWVEVKAGKRVGDSIFRRQLGSLISNRCRHVRNKDKP
ncbi:uncharacterized protein LOC118419833 [Branchiostoma floridae]|uniref:Uncharacterized protein LOC118419833 n=1 Tax=Branchiostoma floridae TaxID=7739 RepID=C3YS07_BRAFL|nr:uncharacterized protein LOC118419833 [Branchiostoma floridae]|eukprot:XP_002600900.1 hypothetical protein BRAFLDRAFT_121113 [Branchiostoma floridae]